MQLSPGVYQFAHNCTNQVPLVNYDRINAKAFHSDDRSSDQHFAMAESPTSSSFDEGQASFSMVETFDNIAQLIAQQ